MKENNTPGYVIHSFTHPRNSCLYLVGRLKMGETFVIREDRLKSAMFLRQDEHEQAQGILQEAGGEESSSCFRTLDGANVIQVTFKSPSLRDRCHAALRAAGVRTYEGDITLADQYTIRHRLHGPLTLTGKYTKGTWVDRIYLNPEVEPAFYNPRLVTLSLDIETDVSTGVILSLALAGENPWKGGVFDRVLLLGEIPSQGEREVFASEGELLKRFSDIMRDFDPDIITGWNVVDFDFACLSRRFAANRIPFRIGRAGKDCVFLPADKGGRAFMVVPGRQVIDAMWLMRFSPDRYPDYKLETVARRLLGEGKDVAATGVDKIKALKHLYLTDPAGLAAYCLQDARLVLRILEVTGMLSLSLSRSLLTGVPLDKCWRSVRPFERLYIEGLRERNLVAPSLGVDSAPVHGAAGGLILPPEADLFPNVYVFDFKSLYPSIIRTFNIDPAAWVVVPPGGEASGKKECIRAPNGACFSREPGVLPQIISRFFENRRAAQARGDHIASYVYKILMNSFYGVLGTPGCRFASALFTGAITGFGQLLLGWCRDLLAERGYRVIYGDTDSLFVLSRLEPAVGYRELDEDGNVICGLVNRQLAAYVRDEYGVVSFLELEFEKIYSRLFIPPLRMIQGERATGRAKGYAGYIFKDVPPADPADALEIKGMEAVRSDWTELAHNFQKNLLLRIFTDCPETDLLGYLSRIREDLFNGKLDEQLIYRKRLRRPLDSYTKSRSPQVKAALQLGWKHERGRVEYFMTSAGPQPRQMLTAPLDYKHYLDKQLKPILAAMDRILPPEALRVFSEDQQPWLFDGDELTPRQ